MTAPRAPILRRAPLVLLDDATAGPGETAGLLFTDPHRVITADTPDAVLPAVDAMETALAAGHHLAGWIGYEAAAAFEPRLARTIGGQSQGLPSEPLVWMGVFDAPQRLDGRGLTDLLAAADSGSRRQAHIEGLRFGMDRAGYGRVLARIADYLAAGDAYQVNFTLACLFDIVGDPLALYRDLRAAQPVPFAGYIDTGAWRVLSHSPELFLRRAGDRLTTRPMKGTAPRGRWPEEDAETARALSRDPKSRAENLMIVDLLRNDLSRVAETGSVAVDRLFHVERYQTLLQMTSTVSARVDRGVGLRDLLAGLFPCGSVTGAPKLRAMEIIAELETAPRGVYTGAVGCVAPGGDLALNVAIRTIVADRDGRARMGVGGGIVADSRIDAEYDECRLKAAFLTARPADFELIETLLWTRTTGLFLLDHHLARLAASAGYFGFALDTDAVAARLRATADGLAPDRAWRVRLLLARTGAVSVGAVPVAPVGRGAPVAVGLADQPVDSRDRFLFHKTTRRDHYDTALAEARQRWGCFDVLFVNERGELTEGALTNLFVERDGRLLTPPVSCGLLAGTLRAALLASADWSVAEAVLYADDLRTADRLWLGNSVRGLVPARLVGRDGAARGR